MSIFILCHGHSVRADEKVYQFVTGDNSEGERTRWDAVFNTGHYVYGKEPAEFIKKNIHRFKPGRALDIAMGEGRNAVYLAKKGFQVDGVDYSEVALRKARLLAKEHNVSIHTINQDLSKYRIQPGYYDLIVNINYLQRSLYRQIKNGLKPGGILVFENWTTDQLKNKNAQSLPKEYLLERGELKRVFSDFEIIVYHEQNDGKNAVASLIARKPKQQGGPSQ